MSNKTNNNSTINLSILDSATGPVPYKLTNDYLFRAVMQKNENVLKSFICALLHISEAEVKSIKILNPIVLGETIDAKTFILDLNILLNDNNVINIELQITNYGDWPERSLSYLSREFDNLNHGEDYINVHPTHHISILDFTLFPSAPEFFSTNKMMNTKTHQIYSDKFILSVLDLTQIQLATKEDKASRLDYWARLFLAQTWVDSVKINFHTQICACSPKFADT